MSKPTIHFVYTVPRGYGIFRRAIDKMIVVAHLPPLHRLGFDLLIPWGKPIRAPHSISYHLLHSIKEKTKRKYRVRFYSMYEKGAITLGTEDIFIGQPTPAGGLSYNGRPDTDEHDSVTSATLRKYKGGPQKKFLIIPYADDPLLMSWAKDLAIHYADNLILIGGEIWTKNWTLTPFGAVDQKKTLRVDMGIDMNDYPLVKKKFNPPGKRNYFYIGHNAWYKNTKQLEAIARAMPEHEYIHIGGGEIKGWKKLSSFAVLTPEFMSRMAEEYDVFVNTSSADAQATTILEEMCFGFAVACTPETGYEYPSLAKLSMTDTDHNVKILNKLQYAEETELLRMAMENREIARTGHSWKKFAILSFLFWIFERMRKKDSKQKKVLVTGSAGLIGSEAARFFVDKGFHVFGIDNDMRKYFFGDEASTQWNNQLLKTDLKNDYSHFQTDIRDAEGMEKIFKLHSFDIIIHTAAQPSHDWAAKDPLTDFEINAGATLILLENCRKYSPRATFIFTSTNKVYGDNPNYLPLIELEKRFEIDPKHRYKSGIDESMSIDHTTHSVFGASKVAADIMVQEYGRYFKLNTVVFRGGCLTGPQHSGAKLHGFLAYLVKCILEEKQYTIYGYKGKQVRDNIHAHDLVNMFWHFHENPRPGEVYNAGGGRSSNISVLEAIEKIEKLAGKKVHIEYSGEPRRGDHIWYISDTSKFQKHYPHWKQEYDIDAILKEMVSRDIVSIK